MSVRVVFRKVWSDIVWALHIFRQRLRKNTTIILLGVFYSSIFSYHKFHTFSVKSFELIFFKKNQTPVKVAIILNRIQLSVIFKMSPFCTARVIMSVGRM